MKQYKNIYPVIHLKLFSLFLILALLCCLWALLASHLGALMKTSFLLVVPFIIGALIVYIQNYRKTVSFIQSFKVIIIFLVLIFDIPRLNWHQSMISKVSLKSKKIKRLMVRLIFHLSSVQIIFIQHRLLRLPTVQR